MNYFKTLGTLALCIWVAHAQAQPIAVRDYPSRPIKMVIPYAAGGPMDFIGRTLGPRLAQSWGQPLVIDNRAGAGGAIGTDVVAKSAPDGYTLLNTSSSHASLPVVSPSLPYDQVQADPNHGRKDYKLSEKTMKFLHQVKDTADKKGNIKISDRFVKGLKEHGVKVDCQWDKLPKHLQGGFNG